MRVVRDLKPQNIEHGLEHAHQLNFNIVIPLSVQIIRIPKLGSGLLTFILIISLLSIISLPKANAATGTITAGNCSVTVGETTKSLYSTKCVKGKTTKFVKKGSKCPKGFVKKK